MKESWDNIEKFRETRGDFATKAGDRFGLFILPMPDDPKHTCALCIVSDGTGSDAPPGEYPAEVLGWEHVSVHIREKSRIIRLGKPQITQRTPTWDEMCVIKHAFWSADECVIQYHPPEAEYINRHPHCLHLWKRTGFEMPLPPSILVG